MVQTSEKPKVLIAFVELGVEPLSEERILLIAAMALLILILLAVIAFGFYKLYMSLDKFKKQIDVLINKVKKQMNKLLETFSAYFSQEHEAPTKVKTIKDGTRSHEFHED